jgi:hypothetical protein
MFLQHKCATQGPSHSSTRAGYTQIDPGYKMEYLGDFRENNTVYNVDFIHKSYEVSDLRVTFADSTRRINRLLAPDLQPLPNIICLANVIIVPYPFR